MRLPSRLLIAAGLAATALGAACQRKAPGPAECRDFARRVIGVRDERALASPRVRVRVDELTRACLVTPYDRELVRCVELGAPAPACMRAFNARAAQRART